VEITKVTLKDFRNITNADINLGSGINIFYGSNAQGKTNFLESLYICSTGRSHRTKYDRELIRFGEKEAHIRIYVKKANLSDRIDTHIKLNEKKGIAVNGIPIKKSRELFGTLYTVIFSPEDLQLIKNAPSERRKFMDMQLAQINPIYCNALSQYYRILKQRNNLLKNIQKNKKLKETLFVWDSQLVNYGIKIIEERQRFIKKISEISGLRHEFITDNKEKLSVSYKPDVSVNDFKEKLHNSIERDIISGTTNCGPHRDDINFIVDGNDVKIYGSQGQQRTASLSAKLAQIDIIESETNQKPVLLLDDVLSELDEKRQHCLMECISNIQTIITCTGIEDTVKKYSGNAKIFRVENGNIISES
jgi:DNA replication and repair protein RecF